MLDFSALARELAWLALDFGALVLEFTQLGRELAWLALDFDQVAREFTQLGRDFQRQTRYFAGETRPEFINCC